MSGSLDMAEVATPQTLFIEHIKSEVKHVLSEKRNGGYDDSWPDGEDLLNMRNEISKAVWTYFQKMLLNNRIDLAFHTIKQFGQFCLTDRQHKDLRAIRSCVRRYTGVGRKPQHRFSSLGKHYEAMLRRELAQQVELIFKARIELGGLFFDARDDQPQKAIAEYIAKLFIAFKIPDADENTIRTEYLVRKNPLKDVLGTDEKELRTLK
jgi:hypothetical protein